MVAANVIRERENAGITKVDLARKAGLPPQTIKRIEDAENEPRILTLFVVCLAMDVPLRDLLAGLLDAEPAMPRDAVQTNRSDRR